MIVTGRTSSSEKERPRTEAAQAGGPGTPGVSGSPVRSNPSSQELQAAFNEDLYQFLVDVHDYMDGRADADMDQDGYVPNAEMRLLGALVDSDYTLGLMSRLERLRVVPGRSSCKWCGEFFAHDPDEDRRLCSRECALSEGGQL